VVDGRARRGVFPAEEPYGRYRRSGRVPDPGS
jgi:hypothetical protein